LLQARYYDGSKGEFLSEDPVFLGDPKQQVLTDPQSLNSYSYANSQCYKSVTRTNQYFGVPTKYVAESFVTLAMCAKAVCTALKSAASVT